VKQILLVEDNAGDVLAIRQILAALPIRISVARDGEQAIQILEDPEFKPDLIILDLNIPKVPGLAVLERCKPTAPVVVFTSSSNPTERQRAKKLGASEFVQKPYDLDEFANVVMRMIEEWAKPANGAAAE
jgi:CheY-like chemotaxis protein